MHPLPHLYKVSAQAAPTGNITSAASGLPQLIVASPREFDGPGDQWSPESLLCAALANCLILTFRAVALASKFEWLDVSCRIEGALERVDGVTRFTRYATHATLKIPSAGDAARARMLLEKSERACLISNSVNGERHLEIEITTGA